MSLICQLSSPFDWLMSAVILVADTREHTGNKRPYQAKCVRQMISILGAFPLWDQEIYPAYIYLSNQPTNRQIMMSQLFWPIS